MKLHKISAEPCLERVESFSNEVVSLFISSLNRRVKFFSYSYFPSNQLIPRGNQKTVVTLPADRSPSPCSKHFRKPVCLKKPTVSTVVLCLWNVSTQTLMLTSFKEAELRADARNALFTLGPRLAEFQLRHFE